MALYVGYSSLGRNGFTLLEHSICMSEISMGRFGKNWSKSFKIGQSKSDPPPNSKEEIQPAAAFRLEVLPIETVGFKSKLPAKLPKMNGMFRAARSEHITMRPARINSILSAPTMPSGTSTRMAASDRAFRPARLIDDEFFENIGICIGIHDV